MKDAKGQAGGSKAKGKARTPILEASSDGIAIVGRVVYSAAGRDKKRPFIIVGVTDDGSALIADGKLRPVSKPKRKNLAHLIIKDAAFGEADFDDAAVREFLRSYEEKAR